jgi:plasmid maintenance system antidote protein VapI
MERWRCSQGVSHTAFATSLGRSRSEWSHIYHGRRPVSRTLAARVLATAEEPWRSAFERAYVDDLAAENVGPKTPAG